MKALCPLCEAPEAVSYYEQYFHCPQCDYRFLDPKLRLKPAEEKARYLEHNNDVDSPAYQNFMQPVVDQIVKRVPAKAKGLDFGAGTGPVLKHMLEKRGFSVALYDPYFWPDPSPLSEKYDFIAATEVVEHLFEPGRELRQLQKRLLPKGLLVLMTLLFTPETDFGTWYYRRDPTHVGFFSEKTFQWLAQALGFKSFEVVGDRIALFLN